MSTTTTTIKTDGSFSLLSGSTAEGQTYARHLADQNIQDIDILIHCGIVKCERNLIQTGIPGYVRIRADDGIESTGSIQFAYQNDVNGVHCLNGYSLKEQHCTNEIKIGAPFSYVTRSGETESDASSAAAKQTISYKTIDIGKQFNDALVQCEQLQNQLNFVAIRTNYVLFTKGVCRSISEYALPLSKTTYNESMFQEMNINEQTFRDLFTLVGPVYDHCMPQVTLIRIKALFDFYDKYAEVGNPEHITDMMNYFQTCAPTDMDFVPSLRLKFWPNDIQPFLERIKRNRPKIYDLIINTTSMHVIPKWSTKTLQCDRQLEFRYSFSAVELLLAQQRSLNERILNGIARSIYYKFLKDQKSSTQNVLPSYFIKSTVLWMCETEDVSEDTPEILAKKWLNYAIDLLNQRNCPHYIIPDLNILEPYSSESLQEARKILLKVDVNEIHEIKMFSATRQKFYRDKFNDNIAKFLSQLKASDILNALKDYRQLKKEWISLDPKMIIDDDEIDMAETFIILNALRALDGEFQNLRKFRQLFIDSRPSFDPIWGETVNRDTAADFAETFMNTGVILTLINENVSSNTLLPEHGAAVNMEDFQNYQNVLHQYLDPQTFSSSLQSTYAYLYNQSVGAFEQRRVTDHHPYGPTMNNSGIIRRKRFFSDLIDLCRNASNSNLTLRQLAQQQSLSLTEDDEQVALAVQLSLDDQSNHSAT